MVASTSTSASRLSLSIFPDGVQTEPGPRVAFGLERNEASLGAATIDGPALVWELGEPDDSVELSAPLDLDPAADWLVRCDRVDFSPGAVAYRHTHPGPGIRVLLHGSIRIESAGTSKQYGPLEPWFESGPEPVYAEASTTLESAFVRVMLLPREWAGRRTIRYVDPADADKPKSQSATVLLERPIDLAR